MAEGGASDPRAAARKFLKPHRVKRFYTRAEAVWTDRDYELRLDGKLARTPGRNRLATPHRRLAAAMAAEWNGQGALIDPATMPVTRLANTAIDGVAGRTAEVQAATFAYAASDLLCYRAGEPAALVERQDAAWNPILAWAETRFRVRFILAEGVTHVAQPETTLARMKATVEAYDEAFRLAGLHLATTLSGSLLITLGLAEGELDAERAWAAAHVDEDWNISRWGEDAEARAWRDARFADFGAAALALAPE